MDAKRRGFLVGVLLLLIGGLCVQFATADHWSYPTVDALDTNPDTHDGEQVLLFATVQAVDRGSTELVVTPDADERIEFTVTNVPPGVLDAVDADGATVQVYGTFEAPGRVAADRIVVDVRHTDDRRYVYATSVVGGLLAVAHFLRHWRVDVRTLRLRSRRDR